MTTGTIRDWQKNSENLRPSSLPENFYPGPPGFYQILTYREVPFYTDPDNKKGSEYLGEQKVAVPVLGLHASGMRCYPHFVNFDQSDGSPVWDFSNPRIGTPPIKWEPRLDPRTALDIEVARQRREVPKPPSLWTSFWNRIRGRRSQFNGS